MPHYSHSLISSCLSHPASNMTKFSALDFCIAQAGRGAEHLFVLPTTKTFMSFFNFCSLIPPRSLQETLGVADPTSSTGCCSFISYQFRAPEIIEEKKAESVPAWEVGRIETIIRG